MLMLVVCAEKGFSADGCGGEAVCLYLLGDAELQYFEAPERAGHFQPTTDRSRAIGPGAASSGFWQRIAALFDVTFHILLA